MTPKLAGSSSATFFYDFTSLISGIKMRNHWPLLKVATIVDFGGGNVAEQTARIHLELHNIARAGMNSED